MWLTIWLSRWVQHLCHHLSLWRWRTNTYSVGNRIECNFRVDTHYQTPITHDILMLLERINRGTENTILFLLRSRITCCQIANKMLHIRSIFTGGGSNRKVSITVPRGCVHLWMACWLTETQCCTLHEKIEGSKHSNQAEGNVCVHAHPHIASPTRVLKILFLLIHVRCDLLTPQYRGATLIWKTDFTERQLQSVVCIFILQQCIVDQHTHAHIHVHEFSKKARIKNGWQINKTRCCTASKYKRPYHSRKEEWSSINMNHDRCNTLNKPEFFFELHRRSLFVTSKLALP